MDENNVTATPSETVGGGEDESALLDTTGLDTENLTASQKRKITMMIDGQSMEEEVDEEDLIKAYQQHKASSKRFSEAAQMRKQAETFLKMLKDKPDAVFSELGMNPREWAEQYLVAQLEEERLDPKEKELRQYKKQLEALESEKKAQVQAQQQQMYTQLTEHYQQDFEKQIIDNLNTSGLPRTEHTVSRMAYYMSKALDAGLNDVTFADIVPLVKQDYETEVKSLFGSADIEKLINLVGEEPIKKLRTYDLNRAKQQSMPTGGRTTPKFDHETAPQKKMTRDEMRDVINERVNSLSRGG